MAARRGLLAAQHGLAAGEQILLPGHRAAGGQCDRPAGGTWPAQARVRTASAAATAAAHAALSHSSGPDRRSPLLPRLCARDSGQRA